MEKQASAKQRGDGCGAVVQRWARYTARKWGRAELPSDLGCRCCRQACNKTNQPKQRAPDDKRHKGRKRSVMRAREKACRKDSSQSPLRRDDVEVDAGLCA